jgi:hypothetical protein
LAWLLQCYTPIGYTIETPSILVYLSRCALQLTPQSAQVAQTSQVLTLCTLSAGG